MRHIKKFNEGFQAGLTDDENSIYIAFYSKSPFSSNEYYASSATINSDDFSSLDECIDEYETQRDEYFSTHKDDPDMPPEWRAKIYCEDNESNELLDKIKTYLDEKGFEYSFCEENN